MPTDNISSDIPAFELKNVARRFGKVESLSGINLRIEAGEKVALVGSSGAGKSTLLSLLNGSLLPSEGEVWVLGRNLGALRPQVRRHLQRQIGTVYQQFHLVENLRVIHNINAGNLGNWPLWKAAVSLMYPLEVKAASEALIRVGIPEKLFERTDRLSGGQRQRVAIARVLVQNSAVILADEPISSLDPERSLEIMDLLSKITRERGTTLVVSLHAIEFARSHCDRVVGLQGGRIQFDISASDLTDTMIKKLYTTQI